MCTLHFILLSIYYRYPRIVGIFVYIMCLFLMSVVAIHTVSSFSNSQQPKNYTHDYRILEHQEGSIEKKRNVIVIVNMPGFWQSKNIIGELLSNQNKMMDMESDQQKNILNLLSRDEFFEAWESRKDSFNSWNQNNLSENPIRYEQEDPFMNQLYREELMEKIQKKFLTNP